MDKIIPKFKGIKVYEEEIAAEITAEDCDIGPEKPIRPPKRKSLEIDPKLRVESNEKRLKSLKEKLDFDKKQQFLVKEAINSGKRINKRIVFDHSSGDDINQSLSGETLNPNDNCVKRTDPKHKKLFNSDSEDDSNEDIDGNKDNNRLKEFELDFDKKINNKNAEKLIELNSRFAHDSRFRIDERFLDQIDDNEEVIDEKQKNLHLLEEVLGKKLKPIIKSKDKSFKTPENKLFVSRFDPKSEKSSEYEIKSSLPEKKSAKKVSFDQKVLAKEEEKSKLEEEVSKEVYYEVSSSLKDSLTQKEDEFSLTQMFGTPSAEDISDDKSTKDKNLKPIYHKLDDKRKSNVSPNPFKYDSSSSDEEEDNEEVVIKTKSDSKAIEDKSKPVSSGFKFFFDKNDSRFSEDIFCDKDLVQKARNDWKERQLMIMRSMRVRKRSAKKNKKSDHKSYLKFKKNPNFKPFPKKVNKSFD